MSSIIQVTTAYYPESDGRPMGETDLHRNAMFRHIELLTYHFRAQRAYVSGDLLVYYEQGNPKKFVVPDAFVAKGVRPGMRRVYKIWVEGKAPDVAIETTSRKTKKRDTIDKPKIYARIGIKEYFMFDPTQDYLDPPLQGYRLAGDDYILIEPSAEGALFSEQLGLRLKLEGAELEFFDSSTGERLLTNAERLVKVEIEKARAVDQKARAENEKTRADERLAIAEAELERLRRELLIKSDT